MIYNENITTQYGAFLELTKGTSPVPFKPSPTKDDYATGYIVRTFAKKTNEELLMEVQPNQAKTINASLYRVVTLNWKISGPKNTVYTGNVVDSYGVIQQNQYEIARIKTEQEVDLTKVLPNLLEFWKGR